MDEPKLNRFAVIGNPIDHSLSPYIHQSFASQFNLRLSYEKILATEDSFSSKVKQFFAEGGRGLNITTPFKSMAADLVNSCSIAATAGHSVNTIYIDQQTGLLVGESTDGCGWLAAARRCNITLENSRILVIGAGGAARIIINQLLSEAVQAIHVCNRTESRAKQLINEKITASGLNDIPATTWDLIINTLSVGWQGNFPLLNITVSTKTKAYDLNYGKGAQSFNNWFLGAGGQAAYFYDGWGMLVEQAAESFYLWWKKKPLTVEIINKGNP